MPKTKVGGELKKHTVFERTDWGNGERFAHLFGHLVKFNCTNSRWYMWTGKYWEGTGSSLLVRRFSSMIAKDMLRDLRGTAPTDKAISALRAYAKKTQATATMNNMLHEASAQPQILRDHSSFDQDRGLLNCRNGTIELDTGTLREHRQEDMLTKICPVKYCPGAKSDLLDMFLRHISSGNKEYELFLQRAAGYSLHGDPSEEVLFFIWGKGGGGKSTFLEGIRSVLGDYGMVADFKVFLTDSSDSLARSAIALMDGKRVITSIEVGEGKKLAEGVVKVLTGRDTVQGRFLYKEAFNFRPAFQLWLSANSAPRVGSEDTGIWRRMVRLPFTSILNRDEQDGTVKKRLVNTKISGEAWLAWMVQGYLDWKERGLDIPEVVRESTEQYRADQNPMKEFLEDRCMFDGVSVVPVKVLRNIYELYCRDVGNKFVVQQRTFNRIMEKSGAERISHRYDGRIIKVWKGLKLKQ